MSESAKDVNVVPSYAVTTIPGSGHSSRIGLKSELDETVNVEVLPVQKVEGVEAPKIVTPQDEEPVEPAAITESPSWAQSYSVTSQPGSPRLSPKAELKELEPESHPEESVQEPPEVELTVELANVPETVVTPAVEGEDAAEHMPEEPKSTWTQSYSVTSQPGSPRVSPKQVSEEIPEVEAIEPSWTQSYSVTSQPGSPRILPKEDMQEPTVEPAVVADFPVATPLVEEAAVGQAEAGTEDQTKSTWTPSYSVTTLDGQTEQNPHEDAEPEPVSVLKAPAVEAPPEIHVPVTDTSSDPLAVKDEQSERPKSPWTPSYSVTTLPGSSPMEEHEPSVDTEPPAPESARTEETVEDQPKENGRTSDVFEVREAVSELTPRDEFRVGVETLEPDHHGVDLVSPFPFVEPVANSETIFSPSRIPPLRSRRSLPGLLPTRLRTFLERVRR